MRKKKLLKVGWIILSCFVVLSMVLSMSAGY
jgi:hypothetical protein